MRFRVRNLILSLFLPVFCVLFLLYVAAFQLTSDFVQVSGYLSGAESPSVVNPKCPDVRSGYCILVNYQPAQAIVGHEDSVTLTTQGTVAFLHHVPILCQRWMGPISVSVYAPGTDFKLAKQVIENLRSQEECVRKWVSWHIIFDKNLPPEDEDFAGSVSVMTGNVNSSLLKEMGLVYPINVARNVARLNARTKFVFASDIELYPSKDIIPRFLKMVKRLSKKDPDSFSQKRQIFVLPVFEVSKDVVPPLIKAELIALITRKQAVSFHRYMCNICHQIPNFKKWLRTNSSHPERMEVFLTTKRLAKKKLGAWEPFFIGTNREPFFDERLSWNGKINKMQISYELCLLNYDFVVLDGAFLTHAPGIKVFSEKEQAPRAPYMKKNNAVFQDILQELKAKYGTREEC